MLKFSSNVSKNNHGNVNISMKTNKYLRDCTFCCVNLGLKMKSKQSFLANIGVKDILSIKNVLRSD